MTEEELVRQQRLLTLRRSGADPYPARVHRTHTVEKFLLNFTSLCEKQTNCSLVGRLRTIRKHGGLTFCHLEDGTGIVQIVFKKDRVGEEAYERFHTTVDMGDFIEVEGVPFVTKKNERSLVATTFRTIAKSLLPMPEKWHGLADTEIRYRQRELDMMSNPHVRHIFKIRATALSTMRRFLDDRGFIEVETPMLQAIAGGANARPFVTHHNALDVNMYLRVAPELFLKRLIVGGYERVYEVARCFRNEGIDHAHNPEFTQVEGYAAYMDYRELMDLMEEMTKKIIGECGIDPAAVDFQGNVLNFKSAWERITFREAIFLYTKIDIDTLTDRERLAKAAMSLGVPVEKSDGRGKIFDNIYKHTVRPKLVAPTYIIDHPVELSPLAKRKTDNENYVERFQLVYGGGVENMNAFSELNDPTDQEERFLEQQQAREEGDDEAQQGDPAFIRALKHGLPPTAGWGIGIDRLTALLVNSHNLKEVILFPTLRPEDFSV